MLYPVPRRRLLTWKVTDEIAAETAMGVCETLGKDSFLVRADVRCRLSGGPGELRDSNCISRWTCLHPETAAMSGDATLSWTRSSRKRLEWPAATGGARATAATE